MLMPVRTKYRKMHRGRMRGMATRGAELSFGEFGLQAMECSLVTDRQIEAARLSLVSAIHKKGKMWIRIFRTSQSPRSPRKRVWALARETWTTGQQL